MSSNELHLRGINLIRSNAFTLGVNGVIDRTTVNHVFQRETGFYTLQPNTYEAVLIEDVDGQTVLTSEELLRNGITIHPTPYKTHDGYSAVLITVGIGPARLAPTAKIGYIKGDNITPSTPSVETVVVKKPTLSQNAPKRGRGRPKKVSTGV